MTEPEQLVGDEHLMRNWHNWEGGHRFPQGRYRELIALAFSVDADDLFSGRSMTGVYAEVAPETLDLLARLRRSDIGQAELDTVTAAVDQLATRYSSDSPADLLDDSNQWLVRLDHLLNSRVTTTQRNGLMVAAGWLGLLIGSLNYDMNDSRATGTIRRYVADIAAEVNHDEIAAWVHELKAWTALNEGDYPRATTEAEAGRCLAPHSPVSVQLAGHQAEALARIGDLSTARRALDTMNDERTRLPEPENPRHHFHLEPRKFDKVEMRLLTLFGDHDQAADAANQILTTTRRPDGTWRQPMLAAKALATLGAQAAHHRDTDQAVKHGHQALDIPRQSIPSLQSSLADILHALEPVNQDPRVMELAAQTRNLTS